MKSTRLILSLVGLVCLSGCLELKETTVLDESSGNYQAWGLVINSSDDLLVADRVSNKIRKVNLETGLVTDFAGSGAQGATDGNGLNASFSYPGALAIDSQDNTYVGDWSYHPNYLSSIRKLTPTGDVTTIATLPTGTAGYIVGLVVDSNGTVYAATPYEIFQISSSGIVTSFAGSGSQGDVDGVGAGAQFYQIFDMTIDSSDNLWIATASATAFKIKKVDPSSTVTTQATLGAATAISYSNGFIYMLDGSSGMGNISRLKVADLSSSTILTNAFSSSNGGQTLLVHPTLGIFLGAEDDTIKRYTLY